MPHCSSPRRRSVRRRGFTLLELIVVITIIGILSTIAAVSTSGVLRGAKRKAARASMEAILNAAEMVYTITGSYPQTLQELIDAKDDAGERIGLGKYEPDPWGTDYEYALVDGKPHVRSLGSDRMEGGTGEAEDLVLPGKPER